MALPGVLAIGASLTLMHVARNADKNLSRGAA
jgi:hypothetical protein